MIHAPIPLDEKSRLCSVYDLKVLETEEEERFDRITRKAIQDFHVPISTITVIDQNREWFKSKQGTTVKEAPRTTSFCGHALLQQDIMIIEDTLKDIIFSDNPQVIDAPHIRFYAGKSLYKRDTFQPVGVFCIKGFQPRQMTLAEIGEFLELAAEAENELNKIKW